jgi:chaperone modulatory protein CbpM
MIGTHEFLVQTGLDAQALESWVGAEWLLPQGSAGTRRFSAIDVARARLIRDLKREMGVNDDGVGIILDLVDQVHGLRWTVRELLVALCAQPDAVRRRIVDDIVGAAELDPDGPGEHP